VYPRHITHQRRHRDAQTEPNVVVLGRAGTRRLIRIAVTRQGV
jgi:hypothetical protein